MFTSRVLAAALAGFGWRIIAAEPLAGTQPLTIEGDLSAQMVEGIDRWLMRETERVAKTRKLDLGTPDALEKARALLRQRLGMIDETIGGAGEKFASIDVAPLKSPGGK